MLKIKNKTKNLGKRTLRTNNVFKLSIVCSALLTTITANSASYKAELLETFDYAKDAFSTAINDRGVVATAQRGIVRSGPTGSLGNTTLYPIYNFPIDFIDLDYDEVGPLLENEADVRDGVFSLYDQRILLDYYANENNTLFAQKLGMNIAATVTRTKPVRQILGDKINTNIGEYTFSTDEVISSINNNGFIAGYSTGAYLPEYVELEDDDSSDLTVMWLREYERRGFVLLGDTRVELVPPLDTYGGHSVATDINNNNVVVGYASVRLNETDRTFIDSCDLADGPEYACYWEYYNNNRQASPLPDYPGDWVMYDTYAYMWKLDSSGNIVDEINLGVAADLTQIVNPDQVTLRSQALAVNNNDIAVGWSDVFVENDPSRRSIHGVVYIDGDILEINLDKDEYPASVLFDINDNNIAVGHAYKRINGFTRSKIFYIDLNSVSLSPIFIDDYFPGSSSTARAINNNNILVGEFEVEAQITSSRRRHAYTYDIDEDLFQDINTFLPCDVDYTVVEARGINDNNEIAVTVTLGADARDALGEPIIDEQGAQLREPIAQAARLVPISGGIENCRLEEEKNKRQGASLTWLSLLGLSGLAILRRRKIAQK